MLWQTHRPPPTPFAPARQLSLIAHQLTDGGRPWGAGTSCRLATALTSGYLCRALHDGLVDEAAHHGIHADIPYPSRECQRAQ